MVPAGEIRWLTLLGAMCYLPFAWSERVFEIVRFYLLVNTRSEFYVMQNTVNVRLHINLALFEIFSHALYFIYFSANPVPDVGVCQVVSFRRTKPSQLVKQDDEDEGRKEYPMEK